MRFGVFINSFHHGEVFENMFQLMRVGVLFEKILNNEWFFVYIINDISHTHARRYGDMLPPKIVCIFWSDFVLKNYNYFI